MEWVSLSILSGFGQALGWALKKKTLAYSGLNNTLGFISFLVAGFTLLFLWRFLEDGMSPTITARFALATLVVVTLNVLAVWSAYRALDKAGFAQLMPFVALTSLTIVPIEYLLRGILPSTLQVVGIVVVVLGAIVCTAREKISSVSLASAGYFGVTLLAYSVTSPFMAVMVEESSSGLFSATVAHLGIALGFLPLVLITGEWGKTTRGYFTQALVPMVIAGLVIALLENGPANVALETGSASEVFGLKRTMPFFALIFGVLMFGEKVTTRHIFGTALLVLGSMLIILFS